MSDVTVTTEAPNQQPLGNDPTARLPDGTMKDQGANTTPTDPTKPMEKPSTEVNVDGAPKTPAKTEPVAGAPEKYEPFKLPEGFKLDEKVSTEVQATFKELGLSQEAGQKLVDFYSKQLNEAVQAPAKLWADTQAQWNKDIGERFGDKADGVRADINKAIDVALPPSLAKNLRTAMDMTGAGSNPDFVEAMSILLKPHFEGKSVPAGGVSKEANKAPGASQVSMADAMYPHLRK